MEDSLYGSDDPIAAAATPWGESALAVIRLSGRGTFGLLGAVFRPAGGGGDPARRRLLRGTISTPGEGRETVDEVMVALYPAPRSYTGEEAAEISCHGSPLIVRRLLDLLRAVGFRLAGPGEFTLRAFLNHKIGLTQAEAVNELIRARTDRARALALHRLEGSVEARIGGLKQALVGLLAWLEVQLDYPEEEQGAAEPVGEQALHAQQDLEALLASYRVGRIYQEGVSAVLAGRTNSGKSTLFNRLLREERAIVSEVHGTTRDYLEASLDIEGIPVRLYDTAGYRETVDELEREGMRRTDEIVQGAGLVLYLVDAGSGLAPLDERFLAAAQGQAGSRTVIPVWSKADLAPGAQGTGAPPGFPPGFLAVSARSGQGLAELCATIAARLLQGAAPAEAGQAVIDSLRQKQLLERAAEALGQFRSGLQGKVPLDLLAVDLREAVDALGEITGEVTSQDVLESIFSRFCVGK